jgi:hypothetical protein
MSVKFGLLTLMEYAKSLFQKKVLRTVATKETEMADKLRKLENIKMGRNCSTPGNDAKYEIN